MVFEPLQVNDRRLAALAVHALSPLDRQWVLSELPLDERSDLAAMLAELDALGIPRDAALLKGVLETSSASRDGQRLPQGAQAEPARQPDPARLFQVLGTEPPGLLARCVASWPASQREAFLALCAPEVDATVRQHLRHQAPAPELQRALQQCVAARLDETRDEEIRA